MNLNSRSAIYFGILASFVATIPAHPLSAQPPTLDNYDSSLIEIYKKSAAQIIKEQGITRLVEIFIAEVNMKKHAPGMVFYIADQIGRAEQQCCISLLKSKLKSKNLDDRLYYSISLRRGDPESSLAALVSIINDKIGKMNFMHVAIAEIWRRKSEEGAQALANAIGQSSDRYQGAAEALADLKFTSTIEPLRKHLNSPDHNVRILAAKSLLSLAPDLAGKTLDNLQNVTSTSGCDSVSSSAAYSLAAAKRKDFQPYYISMASSVCNNHQSYALEALLAIGAPEAEPLLMSNLKTDENRAKALQTLEDTRNSVLINKVVRTFAKDAPLSLAQAYILSTSFPAGDLKKFTLLRKSLEIVSKNVPKHELPNLRPWLISFGLVVPTPVEAAALDIYSAKDNCEHWGGEEGYDEERTKEITQKSNDSCAEMQQIAKAAKQKFPNSAEIDTAIASLPTVLEQAK